MVELDKATDEGVKPDRRLYHPRSAQVTLHATALTNQWNTALWEFETLHGGNMPDSPTHVEELHAIANNLLTEAGVNKDILPAIPKGALE
jgi:hypothetical protein